MKQIPISFISNENLRILIKTPEGIRGLLSIFGDEDGSCYLVCPKKYLRVKEYWSGAIVMKPRQVKIDTIKLDEEEGFVNSEKPPKISLHPSGYIQSSFYSKGDCQKTTPINMGYKLGDLKGKKIVEFSWENLSFFEENPSVKNKYAKLELGYKKKLTNLKAFLKTSFSLNDLLGKNLQVHDDGKLIDGRFELKRDEFKKLKNGELIMMKDSFWDVIGINFILSNEQPYKWRKNKHSTPSIIFGIRDTRNFKEEDQMIIWNMLTFINPDDIDQSVTEQGYAKFTFFGAMKNWEYEKTREVGQQLVVMGSKKLDG